MVFKNLTQFKLYTNTNYNKNRKTLPKCSELTFAVNKILNQVVI